MLRVEHHLLVFFHDIDEMQLDPQLFSHPEGVVSLGPMLVLPAYRMGVAFDAESGIEIDTLHMDFLFLHHPGGEQRIESAGYQGSCLALLAHIGPSQGLEMPGL